jgi:succinate dehydrogenase / fumarate reductase cytochrome b subunit
MKPARPYFLDLAAIRLPIGGMVSILHRASGAALSLVIPCLLYTLMLSLRSPQDFQRVSLWFHGWIGWLLSLGVTWALLHHFLAGLRHLGFDLGLGEGKETARKTAWASLLLAAAATASIALWRLL